MEIWSTANHIVSQIFLFYYTMSKIHGNKERFTPAFCWLYLLLKNWQPCLLQYVNDMYALVNITSLINNQSNARKIHVLIGFEQYYLTDKKHIFFKELCPSLSLNLDILSIKKRYDPKYYKCFFLFVMFIGITVD